MLVTGFRPEFGQSGLPKSLVVLTLSYLVFASRWKGRIRVCLLRRKKHSAHRLCDNPGS